MRTSQGHTAEDVGGGVRGGKGRARKGHAEQTRPLTGVHDVPLPGANPGGQPSTELSTHWVMDVAPGVADTVYSGQGLQEVALGAALYESPGHA